MNTDTISTVLDVVARIGKIARPDADADIYTAGLASVDALELLIELEDAFGVTIPDERFIEARTASSLAALITNLGTGAAP